MGNPLFTDKLTEERKRTTYAKICVEIDTQCKYPETVIVIVDKFRAYNLPIEYNWRAQRCSDCETFGHTNARCPKNKKGRSTTVWLMKNEHENSKEILERETEIGEMGEDGSKQTTPTDRDKEEHNAGTGIHEQNTSMSDGGWQIPGHRKIARKINNPARNEADSPGLKAAFDTERDSGIEDTYA